MSNRLTKSENKRTQGHAFISDQQIADLAQMARSQDKDGFHTLWKAQKEEFLAKADQKIRGGFCLSTDEVVILTHAAEAGDADAFWKLGKAYQQCFTKKIEKMIYHHGIPVDAHDIYASALDKLWERCLQGSFKPTQSFYKYLRTTVYHNVLDYLKKNIIETPESLMAAHKDEKDGSERSILEQAVEPCQENVTFYLEMFQLLCECCAKPHQIIGIGFVKLLAWKPREVVAKLSDETLDILAKRFLEAYYSHFMGVMDSDRLYKSLSYLFEKLDQSPKECYREVEYASTKLEGIKRAGELRLRFFYGKNPSQSLSDWCDKVTRRARKAATDGKLCRTTDS